MTAEKFAVTCRERKDPIPFFRLNPRLNNVVSPGEIDDNKLIDMLLDTKQYLAQTVSTLLTTIITIITTIFTIIYVIIFFV